MTKKHKKNIFIPCLCFILLLLITVSAYVYLKENTYDPLADFSSSDDAFFLAMYPIDGFREEDFKTYEGITLSKSSKVISSYKMMKKAFQTLSDQKFEPKVIYLGLDPAKITAPQAKELLDLFPSSNFKIFLENRPLTEWNKRKDLESLFCSYQELAAALASMPRTKVYPFFAQEWIIADPSNYQNRSGLREDVSQRLFLISLFSDEIRDCHITPDYLSELFEGFHDLLLRSKSGEYAFTDLSKWDLIFLGDSVFGNYSDRRSIPGQVHNMSNANTFNLGFGGACASLSEGYCFPRMLEALLTGDPNAFPADSQPLAGFSEYLAAHSFNDLNRENTLFVLHFGINDYIKGAPVETLDPHDPLSLCGSMRNGIETLKKTFPKASFLLVIPNHIFALDRGMEITSEEGSVYEEYVNGLIRVAQEYGLKTLDNYHQTINADRQFVHVDDGVHPNDYGRFQIAYALMHCIKDAFDGSH